MAHKVGIVGGDGIGPDVVAEGVKVMAAAGISLDTVTYDLGGERYLRDATVLPDEVLDEWRSLDALYFGAVGTPGVPPGVIERGLLLKMRFDLDLYINQRPFTFAGDDDRPAHDFVVIRENTEGTYAGEGGFLRKATPHEIATQGSVNTRHGVRALRPVRLRAGPQPTTSAPHPRPQDQRVDLRRRPVGAHLRRGGRRLRRHRDPVRARRCGLHPLRRVARPLRRHRHRQPLRRHPHRSRRRRVGRHRVRRVGQPASGAGVDVRARARIGPRHRRPEPRQPDRRRAVGGHDARPPRRARRRDPQSARPAPTRRR